MLVQAVILDRYPLPEPGLVAQVLVQHGGLPPPVAAKLASRATAIVWENAPPAAALAVARALAVQGFPARPIAQACVRESPAPRRLHSLALDGEHLGVPLKYNGPPEWVAWNDVLVISAGVFKSEAKRVEQVEMYTADGAVVREERVQVDLNRDIVLDLFAIPLADRGALWRMRIQSHEFNYALALGGTILESWREKFAVLVAKLGLRAEQALVSPQTESLVAAEMKPQSSAIDPYFRSEEEFTAYNRWLLARKLADESSTKVQSPRSNVQGRRS